MAEVAGEVAGDVAGEVAVAVAAVAGPMVALVFHWSCCSMVEWGL